MFARFEDMQDFPCQALEPSDLYTSKLRIYELVLKYGVHGHFILCKILIYFCIRILEFVVNIHV